MFGQTEGPQRSTGEESQATGEARGIPIHSRLSRYATPLIVSGLVILNAALVFPLFLGGNTPYMISIESTFLTDARFIAESLPHVGWNPLWYMGFPFPLFYPPALPYMVTGLHRIADIPVASAYRILTGLSYICIPATLFLFARYLTGRRYPAAIAALIYSLAPSFCYLIPEVRQDAAGFEYLPWRLVVLLRYGEGPHIMALVFTPLAALGLLHAMRRPSLRAILLAALAISAVALTNWIALFALAGILLVVTLSELLVGHGREKLKAALPCAILAYGLCAFWFCLSFIQAGATWSGGGGSMDDLLGNWPALVFIGPPVAVALLLVFGGNAGRQAGFVIGGWLLVFSLIAAGWYLAGIALTPQPNRYLPELNMAVAMALGLLADRGRQWLRQPQVGWARRLGVAYTPALLVSIALVSIPFLRVAHAVTSPQPDVTTTSEYRVAQWLAAHVEGERVYATGSHAFWLNVFTDVPQVRGGADYAATNSWWDHVSYQINTGERGDLAVLWAKALDVRYIVVSYPGSADAYQDYVYPAKFEGLLPRVYDDRGMAIFEVPLARPGLVRVLDLPAYNRLSPIRDVLDDDHLSRYLELVERSSPVSGYHFVNSGHLEFETELDGTDQAVLVRMTYHPGWQVYCNGQRVPIREDLAGFILIEPQRQGQCRFVLQHGPLWDQWLGYALTGLTLVVLVVCGFWRLRSLSSQRPRHRT